jgi:hypothetical protein
MISASWLERWEQITPFLAYGPEVRRVIYTTNSIEALHRQLRKIIKTRGQLPQRGRRPQAHLPRHPESRDKMAASVPLAGRARRIQNPVR